MVKKVTKTIVSSLKESYSSIIRRSSENIEMRLRNQKHVLLREHRNKSKNRIIDAIKSVAGEVDITHCDETYRNEITLQLKIRVVDAYSVPGVREIDDLRKSECESHKKLLSQLDEWEFNAYLTGELKPFEGLPEVQMSPITCVID